MRSPRGQEFRCEWAVSWMTTMSTTRSGTREERDKGWLQPIPADDLPPNVSESRRFGDGQALEEDGAGKVRPVDGEISESVINPLSQHVSCAPSTWWGPFCAPRLKARTLDLKTVYRELPLAH